MLQVLISFAPEWVKKERKTMNRESSVDNISSRIAKQKSKKSRKTNITFSVEMV